jgi:hypothetical protein
MMGAGYSCESHWHSDGTRSWYDLGAPGIVVIHGARSWYDSPAEHHDHDMIEIVMMLVSENSIQCLDARTRSESASGCRRGRGAGTVGSAGSLRLVSRHGVLTGYSCPSLSRSRSVMIICRPSQRKFDSMSRC